VRWLYHVATIAPGDGDYVAPSLATEGFAHCSYKDTVAESARLYFKPDQQLYVLCIDPRRLDSEVRIASTPRGPMPHVHGPIARDAIAEVISLDELGKRPDAVLGTRFAFMAFASMTLLDLVGVYDPISRIASMGFDTTSTFTFVCEAYGDAFREHGASLRVNVVRPDLSDFDVLVLPGGPGTRTLEKDEGVIAWLRSFPSNRLVVSVCTGALLLGAMGRLRGKRAITHQSAVSELSRFGATVEARRVVHDGQVITSGGVTAGIDCGLYVVEHLMGHEVAKKIATQMEHSGP
jgi:putative intracellular protease/amidase